VQLAVQLRQSLSRLAASPCLRSTAAAIPQAWTARRRSWQAR
jgi:hypothetical protein